MNKACGSLIIPLKRINVDLHHKPCKCHLAGLSKSLHSIILSSDLSIVICLHACLPHTHVASKKNTLIIAKSNNKTRFEEIDGRLWAGNLSSVDTIHSSLPFCLPLSCYMLKVLDSPTTKISRHDKRQNTSKDLVKTTRTKGRADDGFVTIIIVAIITAPSAAG